MGSGEGVIVVVRLGRVYDIKPQINRPGTVAGPNRWPGKVTHTIHIVFFVFSPFVRFIICTRLLRLLSGFSNRLRGGDVYSVIFPLVR